ncbi:MAG TPA: 50S ribosomal protein L11 methyltransferase [Kiloniellales bacterium]|jgi:protein arginine N-methyltransferase 1|nr:50S ribosomal protein L11 methyltransferase [Kiloniellales bacterium]
MVRGLFSWIGLKVAAVIIGLLLAGKRFVKSNPRLYGLVYGLHNSREFSDLYEHEKMLADPVRVDTYAEAIKRLIKPGDRVMDLGTGSGVLAILAARQGAKVYAIDHSDFIKVAEENARRNGVEGITFVHSNSKNFQPSEKMDIILHEQIGDNLFNENMVKNLLELKQRLLKPGGKILPGRFYLFLEPVCLYPEYRVPFMEELRPHGIDFGYLAEAGRRYRAAGYEYRRVDRAGVDFFLCEPKPVLSVDLNDIVDPSEIRMSVDVEREVVRPGSLDGLHQYFAVVFDEEVAFDTSPFSPRTCWTNRVFRVPTRQCELGDTISYRFSLGDLLLSDSWKIEMKPQSSTRPAIRQPVSTALPAK